MKERAIIVTASSGEFFHYLQGLVLSVRDKPEGTEIAIGVIDLGLKEEHIRWLNSIGVSVTVPEWEFGLDDTHQLPIPFKGVLARPYYPKYFPGHDIYLHIDSDAWVQCWWAIDLYVQGASKGVMAVTPEIDRSFISNYRTSKSYREFVIQIYSELRGPEAAEKYRDYPILNTGVFALPVASPIWSAWRRRIEETLSRGINFHVEQASLNYEIFENLEEHLTNGLEFLPSVCNWVCHQSTPMFNPETKQLVEPFLPHHPIGVVHRSTDDLKIKQGVEVATTDGRIVRMTLKYCEGNFSADLQSREPEQLSRWQDKNLEWMSRL
jgi:hypothetical protein